MPLVSLEDMLGEALKKKYAIGYFESWNLESLVGVLDAAEAKKSPVIVGFGGRVLGRPKDLEYYAAIGKVAPEKSRVPVNLILNEASSLDQIKRGVELGFSTVMMDGSRLSFAENVELTKSIVRIAHKAGVCVEGQVGTLPMAKDGEFKGDSDGSLTDPEMAAEFVQLTKIDALAISIGNIHLLRKGEAKIDLARLRRIRDLVGIPLVIHGGSGFPRDAVAGVIERGVCKFNVGTILRNAFSEGMKNSMVSEVNPEMISWAGASRMQKVVEDLMELYGSAGKAQ